MRGKPKPTPMKMNTPQRAKVIALADINGTCCTRLFEDAIWEISIKFKSK